MDYSTLITDRTLEDVNRVLELRHKDFQDMTQDEKTEWLTCQKGAYEIEDLNRVGEAVQDLTNRLYIAGYIAKTIPKLDWSMSDIPTSSQLYTYLENIRILKNILELKDDTPECPTSMEKMMYDDANDIEKILFNLDEAIKNLTDGGRYCNTLYCGNTWTQYGMQTT